MLLDGAGLKPSSKGAKVKFRNGTAQVTDGPFVETKELLAGYWMINVNSKAEAIEWAKKVPFQLLPDGGDGPEIEIRQMFELEDFPEVPADVAELEKKFMSGPGGLR